MVGGGVARRGTEGNFDEGVEGDAGAVTVGGMEVGADGDASWGTEGSSEIGTKEHVNGGVGEDAGEDTEGVVRSGAFVLSHPRKY